MRRHEAELTSLLEGVDGWLALDEACTLFDAVVSAPVVDGRVDCVEIGSFKGRSTIALSTALQFRHSDGEVIAIDPHEGEIYGESGDARLEIFTRNLTDRGLIDRVRQVRKLSHDAAPDVAPGSISVLFIDGSHEYLDVVTDIEDWVPKVADGAIVLLNDPFHRGVARAIRDSIVRAGLPLRHPRLASNTLVFDHRPHDPSRLPDRIAALRLRLMLPLGWRLSNLLISLGTTRRWLAFAAPVLVPTARVLVRALVPPVREEPAAA